VKATQSAASLGDAPARLVHVMDRKAAAGGDLPDQAAIVRLALVVNHDDVDRHFRGHQLGSDGLQAMLQHPGALGGADGNHGSARPGCRNPRRIGPLQRQNICRSRITRGQRVPPAITILHLSRSKKRLRGIRRTQIRYHCSPRTAQQAHTARAAPAPAALYIGAR
jgi:hypothetical protein